MDNLVKVDFVRHLKLTPENGVSDMPKSSQDFKKESAKTDLTSFVRERIQWLTEWDSTMPFVKVERERLLVELALQYHYREQKIYGDSKYQCLRKSYFSPDVIEFLESKRKTTPEIRAILFEFLQGALQYREEKQSDVASE